MTEGHRRSFKWHRQGQGPYRDLRNILTFIYYENPALSLVVFEEIITPFIEYGLFVTRLSICPIVRLTDSSGEKRECIFD